MLKNYTFLGGWQTTNLSAILIIAYVWCDVTMAVISKPMFILPLAW